MTLCEFTMEIAEDEIRKRMNDQIVEMICSLSDEMIETAEELHENS